MTPQELAQMIWNIKEIIRDDYNDKNVDEVILPFTLLRRLDCVMDVKLNKSLTHCQTTSKNTKKRILKSITLCYLIYLSPKVLAFIIFLDLAWQIYSPTLKLWEITSKHTLKDLAKM